MHWPGWLAGLAHGVAKALLGEHASHEDLEAVEAALYAWVFALPLVTVLCAAGTSNMTRVPGRLQNLLEVAVDLLTRFVKGLVGAEHGQKFVVFVGSLFIYILTCNLIGVLPGMAAATSTINTTVALALCTFTVTQLTGLYYLGFGYVKHFLGEPLWLAPLMFIIHVFGELARPVSLTLRLMGNIGGEEKAVAIFVALGLATGLFLPLQVPLSALAIFTSFVQALVFCLLSCVYIGGALPHGHGEHDDHGHGHDHGHSGAHAAPATAAAH
jgi:F-type H+-transporting ATPase subunit a